MNKYFQRTIWGKDLPFPIKQFKMLNQKPWDFCSTLTLQWTTLILSITLTIKIKLLWDNTCLLIQYTHIRTRDDKTWQWKEVYLETNVMFFSWEEVVSYQQRHSFIELNLLQVMVFLIVAFETWKHLSLLFCLQQYAVWIKNYVRLVSIVFCTYDPISFSNWMS